MRTQGERYGNDDLVVDNAYVISRLEEAGATLLALPSGGGYTTRLAAGDHDVVRSAMEAYGWTELRLRMSAPSPRKIDEMDEAFAWLGLIPNRMLRRIVGARAMVHPVTERHLFSWRRIGSMCKCDHKAAMTWHRSGIDLIVAALLPQNNFANVFPNSPEMCQ